MDLSCLVDHQTVSLNHHLQVQCMLEKQRFDVRNLMHAKRAKQTPGEPIGSDVLNFNFHKQNFLNHEGYWVYRAPKSTYRHPNEVAIIAIQRPGEPTFLNSNNYILLSSIDVYAQHHWCLRKISIRIGARGQLGVERLLQAKNHTSQPPSCLYQLILPESKSRARIEFEWLSGSIHSSGLEGVV